MTKAILTSRPLSLAPISWVNGITKVKTRKPVDHIAYLKDGFIYESAAPEGVHCIAFDLWKIGREGTTLFVFDLPKSFINIKVFEQHIEAGTGYDYKANLLGLFNAKKKHFKKKANKKMFCSEIFMKAAGYVEPYDWTPADCLAELSRLNFPLKLNFIPNK